MKPYIPTVLLSTKGQFTVPKQVRDHFGLRPGTKITIFPHPTEPGFIATIRHTSRIMHFAGDLNAANVPNDPCVGRLQKAEREV